MKKMFQTTLMVTPFWLLAFAVNDTLGCSCHLIGEGYVFVGDGTQKMSVKDWLKQEYEADEVIDKINDPATLAKIAKNDTNIFMREYAIDKLDDQTLLLDVAQNAQDEWTRKIATNKLFKIKKSVCHQTG